MLEGAKLIGAGAATIALAGAAIGIGNVFSSLIHSVARQKNNLAMRFYCQLVTFFYLHFAEILFSIIGILAATKAVLFIIDSLFFSTMVVTESVIVAQSSDCTNSIFPNTFHFSPCQPITPKLGGVGFGEMFRSFSSSSSDATSMTPEDTSTSTSNPQNANADPSSSTRKSFLRQVSLTMINACCRSTCERAIQCIEEEGGEGDC